MRNPGFQTGWRKWLSWAGVVFLGLGILTIGSTISKGEFVEDLGFLMVALGGGIAGGWWLYCEYRDRRAVRAAEDGRRVAAEAARFLGHGDEEILRGVGMDVAPAYCDRRWAVVGTLAVVLAVTGFIISDLTKDPDAQRDGGSSTSRYEDSRRSR